MDNDNPGDRIAIGPEQECAALISRLNATITQRVADAMGPERYQAALELRALSDEFDEIVESDPDIFSKTVEQRRALYLESLREHLRTLMGTSRPIEEVEAVAHMGALVDHHDRDYAAMMPEVQEYWDEDSSQRALLRQYIAVESGDRLDLDDIDPRSIEVSYQDGVYSTVYVRLIAEGGSITFDTCAFINHKKVAIDRPFGASIGNYIMKVVRSALEKYERSPK